MASLSTFLSHTPSLASPQVAPAELGQALIDASNGTLASEPGQMDYNTVLALVGLFHECA